MEMDLYGLIQRLSHRPRESSSLADQDRSNTRQEKKDRKSRRAEGTI